MSTQQTQYFWNIDRIMKLIIGLAIAAVLIWLIRYLSDVLLPFFAACFIAYMLQPLVELNRKLIHEKGRAISSILTVVEVLAVIVGITWLFLPNVIKELDVMNGIIHDVTSGKHPIPKEYSDIIHWVESNLRPAEIKSQLAELHLGSLISKGTSLLSESISVIVGVLGWALTLIYVMFILIDYPQISRGFKLIIPHKYRARAMVVVREVQTSMNHYFRGQGLVAICAMIFYCIGFSIVGLPLGIPMGILVGILYMIPYFQYVTLIPVAIICAIFSLNGDASFMSLFGSCLLVYLISQSICDYILTPHIMGKEMGMNAAVILLSLSIWGSLLGIIGMIIALPVSSLIMAYYERYISYPRKKASAQTDNSPTEPSDL
ncbi:MAG: AI-2E family transporter [Muribaculaceae bacterium]|nr:AI-2E family transporter [Muribaculaceae bacterium]MDE6552652.1 AI-2E family transporter [Muribaculaceae bacterium]